MEEETSGKLMREGERKKEQERLEEKIEMNSVLTLGS